VAPPKPVEGAGPPNILFYAPPIGLNPIYYYGIGYYIPVWKLFGKPPAF